MNPRLASRLAAWLAAALAAVSVFFALIAFQRAALPYNEDGNHFDGLVNYHEQAVSVFLGIAVIAFLLAAIFFYVYLKIKKKRCSIRH